MKWWPTRRRLIQVYAALLYNAHLKGFAQGRIFEGVTKNVCVPGLNCYSCPGATGACPLGALQNALASSKNRAPYYVLGMLMLFGLVLGRVICGFLCPMGLIQELLHKIPTRKVKKSRVTRALSWVKYAVLGAFVVGVPLYFALKSYPLPAFCKYICPAGTLEGAIGLLVHPNNRNLFGMLGELFSLKLTILIAVIAACVFVYRAFCRFLCPLGAIYGLFCRVALIGVRLDEKLCIDCGLCVKKCGMDVRRVGDHECIHCGECIGVCPTGAISFKAGRITLQQKQPRAGKSRRAAIAWTIALTLLAGMLCFANMPTKTSVPESSSSGAPGIRIPGRPTSTSAPESSSSAEHEIGYEVGMQCPDFTVPLYGGGEFTLSDHRGKTVVINFWATWCSPCIAELPHFQRLHDEHPDDVAVIAIHSSMVTDDVPAFLARTNYTLPFALDPDGAVLQSLGGSNLLPITIIVTPDGTISYNRPGSVTYEGITEALAGERIGGGNFSF